MTRELKFYAIGPMHFPPHRTKYLVKHNRAKLEKLWSIFQSERRQLSINLIDDKIAEIIFL